MSSGRIPEAAKRRMKFESIDLTQTAFQQTGWLAPPHAKEGLTIYDPDAISFV